jgi:hypothetical protein
MKPELHGTYKNIDWNIQDSSDGLIPSIWLDSQWIALTKNGIDDPIVAKLYIIDSIDRMITEEYIKNHV